MSGIGVFRHRSAAKAMEHILGQVKPRLWLQIIRIGIELVERIDAAHLGTCNGAKMSRRNTLPTLCLRADGSLIAIAERIGDGLVTLIQAHVVHCPAVCGNGLDAFGCNLRALAQADIHLLRDLAKVPTQLAVVAHGSIRVAMDQLNLWHAIEPAKQGDTTAFRAQIDGNHRSLSSAHLRYASVIPPSTGIRWPVVQGACGPARKRIAVAQSLGSMCLWVKVLLA